MMKIINSIILIYTFVLCCILSNGFTATAQPIFQEDGYTYPSPSKTSHSITLPKAGDVNDSWSNYRVNQKPQTQTLFSSGIRHGGYGSLIYGITSINGEMAYMRGTRGAWIIHFAENHAIQLGLAGYRTHSGVELMSWSHDDIDEPRLKNNYGGFEVEYVNRSHKLIHFGTQLLTGSGNVRYDNRNLEVDRTRDSYFVLQPGANIHLNVTSWFRVSGGAFYRYTANANLEGTNDRELSGITGILGLRFGRF